MATAKKETQEETQVEAQVETREETTQEETTKVEESKTKEVSRVEFYLPAHRFPRLILTGSIAGVAEALASREPSARKVLFTDKGNARKVTPELLTKAWQEANAGYGEVVIK